ncbi:DUF6262 family protein [Streptomyces sp. B3I8]|jgi:hypothetical protein|uniref:DUF6262 family protein n=1 Tax=Streptomyces sp. B3I8 TaxID=3042303 RepID=UPI00278B502C|nr:DUF6262 family protein [Streptomyces sp. B3I8]MDQ0784531.1 hypothetical protein [Streptomyces sp. B3I8]
MTPLPEHLRNATHARTREAEKRARAALAELVKVGKPISFTAVARQAGVSTDFLYRSPELRMQIERRRAKGGSVPAAPADASGDSSTSAAVRALSARLTRQQETHREELASLRKALEIAQGENLDLRRRLARYEAD